jgi:hypothetical protein
MEECVALTEKEMRHAVGQIPGTPLNVDTPYADVLEMYNMYAVDGGQES